MPAQFVEVAPVPLSIISTESLTKYGGDGGGHIKHQISPLFQSGREGSGHAQRQLLPAAPVVLPLPLENISAANKITTAATNTPRSKTTGRKSGDGGGEAAASGQEQPRQSATAQLPSLSRQHHEQLAAAAGCGGEGASGSAVNSDELSSEAAQSEKPMTTAALKDELTFEKNVQQLDPEQEHDLKLLNKYEKQHTDQRIFVERLKGQVKLQQEKCQQLKEDRYLAAGADTDFRYSTNEQQRKHEVQEEAFKIQQEDQLNQYKLQYQQQQLLLDDYKQQFYMEKKKYKQKRKQYLSSGSDFMHPSAGGSRNKQKKSSKNTRRTKK